MAQYSIRRVSLSPPHFKCATTRMRLRASLHLVFSALMCFLNERRESHQSPRNFVDSSTGRGVLSILTVGGRWVLERVAVIRFLRFPQESNFESKVYQAHTHQVSKCPPKNWVSYQVWSPREHTHNTAMIWLATAHIYFHFSNYNTALWIINQLFAPYFCAVINCTL